MKTCSDNNTWCFTSSQDFLVKGHKWTRSHLKLESVSCFPPKAGDFKSWTPYSYWQSKLHILHHDCPFNRLPSCTNIQFKAQTMIKNDHLWVTFLWSYMLQVLHRSSLSSKSIKCPQYIILKRITQFSKLYLLVQFYPETSKCKLNICKILSTWPGWNAI